MIEVVFANENNFRDIVFLHKKCFINYFTSQLSNKLLKKYYLEFFKNDQLCFLAYENGVPIGFIIGSKDIHKSYKSFLRKNFIRFCLEIIYNGITLNKPTINKIVRTINEKISSKISIKDTELNICNFSSNCCILSMCVLEKFKNTGVSNLLLNEFEKYCINHKITNLSLSIKPYNIRAIKFFTKNNFEIIKTTKYIHLLNKTINTSCI